jgi:mannose/cellobiose epimerase-like protein (N-acyl-D-glucosamine 2-epimerase family)
MTEALYVPEEHLREVIEIIRTGLKAKKKVSREVKKQLTKWCNEEEEYLDQCEEDDE